MIDIYSPNSEDAAHLRAAGITADLLGADLNINRVMVSIYSRSNDDRCIYCTQEDTNEDTEVLQDYSG